MTKLKIITWNVNSIKQRLPLVLELIQETDPDFIFLQETKILDEKFPEVPGYFAYTSGEKGKNGVAILTKHNCKYVEELIYLGRLVSVRFQDVILSSLYMYNGFSLASPKEKKMAMFHWLIDKTENISGPFIIGGDFNIVYKQNEFTIDNPYAADEIYCFQKFEKLFTDTTPKEKFITWWDYRERSFQYDKGFGLDKFYIKNGINHHNVKVLRHVRGKIRTSDHAPVEITISI